MPRHIRAYVLILCSGLFQHSVRALRHAQLGWQRSANLDPGRQAQPLKTVAIP